jgi:D-alanyl-D-alanine carboxypeptidase (penicillin-binding protein 5/6)
MALAIACAGSTEMFVEMMNKKAGEIGMKDTVLHSVHGLPPGKNQEPDVTTARDMAKLCRELLKFPETLKYTSTQMREFRADAPEPFIMRTHNHLLQNFEGCDGFKTGYYGAAGFSIAATAQKKHARAIAVVLGSANRKVRDENARTLLAKGLMEILKKHPVPPPVAKVAPAAVEKAAPAEKPVKAVEYVKIPKRIFYIGLALNGLVILLLIAGLMAKRKKNNRPLMRI